MSEYFRKFILFNIVVSYVVDDVDVLFIVLLLQVHIVVHCKADPPNSVT